MATIQCHRPTNEACQQKCHKPSNHQNSSLGQKVSEMAGIIKGGGHRMHGQPQTTTTHTTTACYTQTVTYKTSEHQQGLGGPKHQVAGSTTTTTDHGVIACNGNKTKKNRRGDRHMKERDGRNLFQKIKDRLSGDSSCSSDDSESESDNEGNGRKHKN